MHGGAVHSDGAFCLFEAGFAASAGAVVDQRFPKSERLRKRREFVRVQRGGLRVRAGLVMGLALPSETGTRRIGFTVSKKVGNAPLRNRVRRRLREIYRTTKPRWPEALDIVIIARPQAARASFEELHHAMMRVTKKLHDAVERRDPLLREPSAEDTPSEDTPSEDAAGRQP